MDSEGVDVALDDRRQAVGRPVLRGQSEQLAAAWAEEAASSISRHQPLDLGVVALGELRGHPAAGVHVKGCSRAERDENGPRGIRLRLVANGAECRCPPGVLSPSEGSR